MSHPLAVPLSVLPANRRPYEELDHFLRTISAKDHPRLWRRLFAAYTRKVRKAIQRMDYETWVEHVREQIARGRSA